MKIIRSIVASIFLVNLGAAITADSIFADQLKPRETNLSEQEVCDRPGVSPSCDLDLEERKSPPQKLKPFTNSQALELINLGEITAQDLYELGTITLKQKYELEHTPVRL